MKMKSDNRLLVWLAAVEADVKSVVQPANSGSGYASVRSICFHQTRLLLRIRFREPHHSAPPICQSPLFHRNLHYVVARWSRRHINPSGAG